MQAVSGIVMMAFVIRDLATDAYFNKRKCTHLGNRCVSIATQLKRLDPRDVEKLTRPALEQMRSALESAQELVQSFGASSNWFMKLIGSHHSKMKFDEANQRITSAEQTLFMCLQLEEREARLDREYYDDLEKERQMFHELDEKEDRTQMMKMIHELSVRTGLCHTEEMGALRYLLGNQITAGDAVLRRLDEIQESVARLSSSSDVLKRSSSFSVETAKDKEKDPLNTTVDPLNSSVLGPAPLVIAEASSDARPVVKDGSGSPMWEIESNLIHVGSEKLGRSTYATVYRGTLWGLEVAVKEFKVPQLQESGAGDSSNSEFMRSFIKEGNLLSRLRHPNIVSFFGGCTRRVQSGSEEPCAIMVTEIAEGGSLDQVLRRGVMLNGSRVSLVELPTITKIAVELASAVLYLHSGDPQVIHGDITPRNVLLTENLTVKLSGFGAAKVREISRRRSLSMGGHSGVAGVGALRWLPPEQLSQNTPATRESDIYSLALILIYLYTGVIPYPDAPKDIALIPLIVQKQSPYNPREIVGYDPLAAPPAAEGSGEESAAAGAGSASGPIRGRPLPAELHKILFQCLDANVENRALVKVGDILKILKGLYKNSSEFADDTEGESATTRSSPQPQASTSAPVVDAVIAPAPVVNAIVAPAPVDAVIAPAPAVAVSTPAPVVDVVAVSTPAPGPVVNAVVAPAPVVVAPVTQVEPEKPQENVAAVLTPRQQPRPMHQQPVHPHHHYPSPAASRIAGSSGTDARIPRSPAAPPMSASSPARYGGNRLVHQMASRQILRHHNEKTDSGPLYASGYGSPAGTPHKQQPQHQPQYQPRHASSPAVSSSSVMDKSMSAASPCVADPLNGSCVDGDRLNASVSLRLNSTTHDALNTSMNSSMTMADRLNASMGGIPRHPTMQSPFRTHSYGYDPRQGVPPASASPFHHRSPHARAGNHHGSAPPFSPMHPGMSHLFR